MELLEIVTEEIRGRELFFPGNKSKVLGSPRECTKVQIKDATVLFQAMNISQRI